MIHGLLLGYALLWAQEPAPSTAGDAELAQQLLADVRAWVRAGELPAAEDLRALCAEAERLGPQPALTLEIGNLGHALLQHGRGDEARALVTWAGARALADGDLATRSWSLDWLGQGAWVRGELEQAAAFLAEAAETDARRGAREDEARHRAEVARIRLTQGKLDEAEAAIARAETAVRAGDAARSHELARVVAEIRGSLLFELGRLREALELCLEYTSGARHDELEVRFDILAADVLADVGRLEAAAVHARLALENALTPDVRRVAPLLHLEPRLTLALLLGDLGRCEEALRLLDEAVAEFERLDDVRGLAWAAKNRGFALFAAGRFAEALPAFEHAWRAGATLGVPFLEGMGALGVAESLLPLASGAEADEERLREALTVVERIADELGERTLEWRGAAVRGARHLARGEFEAALRELRRSVMRIERWRRRLGASGLIEHALRQRSDPYRDAAFAAAHLGRAEEALRYASLLHSRVLDALGARGDGPLPGPTSAELSARSEAIERLEARLRRAPGDGELRAALARAEDELDAALLAAELASGRALSAPDQPLPLERLGAALADQGFDVALVYLVGEDETLALRVVAGGASRAAQVEARRLALGRARLAELIERLRAPIARLEAGELDLAHLGFDARAARELHDALVRPLALPAGARLALVTDGVLSALPFALLVSGGEAGMVDFERPFAHLAGLRFLADEHELVSFGSLARLLHPVPERAGPAVVFLAPAALGVPRAGDEARAVERALQGVRIVADATPADVAALAPGAGLVHFAAHGRIDPARPAHGHLVLGGADDAGARLDRKSVV